MSLSSTDLPLDFGGRNNECVDGLPPCPEFDVSTMQARKQLKKFRWMGRNLLGYEAVARSSICSLMQRWSTKGLASMNDFLDQRISKELRESFFRELQNLESPYSCQRLQIVFSFSIPTDTAIDVIVNLKCSVVSAGAGLGYWEWLCQERGVDLVAFDANDSYPAPMRYMKIHTGSSQDLAMGGRWAAPRWSALFMSWPDAGEHSTFGFDCVSNFQGDVVIHVGETLGHTMSAEPWGQTTSSQCQQVLASRFRCVQTVSLPSWPGHCDSMTIWRRVAAVTTFSAPHGQSPGSTPDAIALCQLHSLPREGDPER
eukprot:m.422476 g.422476  ORF g.422476 m.422476 type:complete len:313 (+) comp21328_c0_seq21:286-1224(+)